MKKGIFIIGAILTLSACGGYTEDQEKAAKEFCDCMDKEKFGDFDIDFYECNTKIESTYPMETFADEGWSLALEEHCPSVAGEIADSAE